jgi:hypothetical protein
MAVRNAGAFPLRVKPLQALSSHFARVLIGNKPLPVIVVDANSALTGACRR